MMPIFGAAAPPQPIALVGNNAPLVLTPKPQIESRRHPPTKPPYPRLSDKFFIPKKPDYGDDPDDAGEDWMPVPLVEASSGNLILYILKENGGTAPSTLLSVKLAQLRPASAPSTLHMTLKKLHEEGKINGDYKAWTLNIAVRVAITDSRMWCALEQLRTTDRAAIRREVIIEALKVNHLMSVATIAECLRGCEWLKGLPIDANTVKADMRILARDKHAVKEGTQWSFYEEEGSQSLSRHRG